MRVLVENTNSTETVFSDESIEVGTEYVYRVKAVNANGVSRWSNYTKVTAAITNESIIVGRDYKSIQGGSSTEMTVGLGHLRKDKDASTVDYYLRGDVIQVNNGNITDVDACEGSNLGQDISITVVDEDMELYKARFGGSGCTEEGIYAVRFVLTDGDRNHVVSLDVEYEVEGEAETIVID